MAGIASSLDKEHVLVPTHPGFAGEPRPEWVDSIDDFARLHPGHASAFRLNIPEEAVCFTIDTGSEEEIVGCARGCVIPELQGPQAIDLYGCACATLK